jgi:hypothetical protein
MRKAVQRVVSALSLLTVTLTVPNAFSQAWLPGWGRGSVSIAYRNFHLGDTIDGNGARIDIGKVRSNVVSFDLEYGVTRRLAIDVGLPLSFQRYTGNTPHPGITEFIDDGNYHGGVQDFRFGARYALVRGALAITPFADVIIPSRDYEVFAHSAIGRNLKELLTGANIGWKTEEGPLSNVYAHTRASYGFVERVIGRRHDRSNIDAEVGYLFTPRLSVYGNLTYIKHHGGLDFDSTRAPEQQWTIEEIPTHDQLIRNDLVDAGGGVRFALSRETSVYANVLRTAWIRNDKLHTGVIVGFNWRFRTRRPAPLPDEIQPVVSPEIRR